MGYRIIYDDEIYHSHKYVAKAKVGNGTRYFYSNDEYKRFLNGGKATIRKIGDAVGEKALAVKGIASGVKTAMDTRNRFANEYGMSREEQKDHLQRLRTSKYMVNVKGLEIDEKRSKNGPYIYGTDKNGQSYRMIKGRGNGDSFEKTPKSEHVTHYTADGHKEEYDVHYTEDGRKVETPVNRSNSSNSTKNRPKSREKNVTNDGKGAKKGSSAPTTAGPIDEREELFNEVKAFIKSRKKKKK